MRHTQSGFALDVWFYIPFQDEVQSWWVYLSEPENLLVFAQ